MTPIWLLFLATKIWEQRELGNIVVFIRNGITIKQDGNFGKPITRIESISEGKLNLNKVGYANITSNVYEDYYLKNNDILFSNINSLNHIGKTSFVHDLSQDVIHGMNLLNIRVDKNHFNSRFVYYQLAIMKSKNLFKKIAKPAVNQASIAVSELKKLSIKTTSIKEQYKIQKLLATLENILTLYERKTRLLSKLRTFLTQRLFSNSSKVSLYFDNKNWSKHKISEFLTERNEKVIPNPSIPLVSFTVEKGVTPKSKRYNREFLVKDDKKKYKITKKNDIVYNPANLKFGAIARNKFGNAAFSPIYVTFITKLNPAFTEFLVRRKNFINLALKYQEGTVYERMAVKSKDFLNLKIYLPNSSRDINHIAQILQSLDTLVSLNKNKVSLITLIKKELLNTMFI